MLCDVSGNKVSYLSARNTGFIEKACISQLETMFWDRSGWEFHWKVTLHRVAIPPFSVIDPSLTEFNKSAKCVRHMQVSEHTAPHSPMSTRLESQSRLAEESRIGSSLWTVHNHIVIQSGRHSQKTSRKSGDVLNSEPNADSTLCCWFPQLHAPWTMS